VSPGARNIVCVVHGSPPGLDNCIKSRDQVEILSVSVFVSRSMRHCNHEVVVAGAIHGVVYGLDCSGAPRDRSPWSAPCAARWREIAVAWSPISGHRHRRCAAAHCLATYCTYHVIPGVRACIHRPIAYCSAISAYCQILTYDADATRINSWVELNRVGVDRATSQYRSSSRGGRANDITKRVPYLAAAGAVAPNRTGFEQLASRV